MEENLFDKSKVQVPEIRTEIESTEKDMHEVQAYIDSYIKDLRFFIEDLSFNADYLEHMQSNNEFAEEYREVMGKDPSTKTYSSVDMEKVQEDIKKTKAIIAVLHEEMNKAALMKIEFGAQKETFEKLERLFNELLMRIPPAQEN